MDERERIINGFSSIEREKWLAIGGVLQHVPEAIPEWHEPTEAQRRERRGSERLALARQARRMRAAAARIERRMMEVA